MARLVANGRAVAFLRHANTLSKAECGGVDFDRVLSEAGVAQCEAARDDGGWVGPLRRKAFGLGARPLVITSPAGRCVDTARRVLAPKLQWWERDDRGEPKSAGGGGGGAPTAGARLVACAELYDDTLQPGNERLFARLGYAPLRAYLDEPGGRELLLDAYAPAALRRIEALADAHAPADGAQLAERGRVLVVCGHAVYTNAIALALARALAHAEAACDVPLDTNLQEVDGFLVSEAGVVRLSELAASAQRRRRGRTRRGDLLQNRAWSN